MWHWKTEIRHTVFDTLLFQVFGFHRIPGSSIRDVVQQCQFRPLPADSRLLCPFDHSGLMLGLGESEAEVLATMDDLLENGCRILTIGQYLRPTLKHLPVAQYVTPEKFAWYKEAALRRGFTYVESGPMVRSSYMAERAMQRCREENKAGAEHSSDAVAGGTCRAAVRSEQ